MNFKWYAIFMGFGTGISWIAWIIIIQTMNPNEAGLFGHLFFYATLFLALVGTLSLLGILYRIGIRKRSEVLVNQVRIAFRHAVLLASLAVMSLWMASRSVLHWYYFILLLVMLSAVEYVFIVVFDSKRR
ncbi:MAG: hypothetical protein ACOYUZ_00400 [Patescibacteria group bacterium]